MNMNEPPLLMRNEYNSVGHQGPHNWLTVKLTGTKSNRSAIGARVVLKTNAHIQVQEITSQSSYSSHNDLRLHFGLGTNQKADQLEIRWPNGQTEIIKTSRSIELLRLKRAAEL